MKRPHYLPCKGNNYGKHDWERLTHNQFEKCRLCGEPRFAMLDRSLSRPDGPLSKFLDKALS